MKLRIVAQLARDLQTRCQPVELVGRGEHVAHHLDQALAGGDLRHPLGVLPGQLEEQGVLVAEMVEDRTARQADGLFQPSHGRTLIPVLGEAAPCAVEDLTAPGRQMILADPWHVLSTASG